MKSVTADTGPPTAPSPSELRHVLAQRLAEPVGDHAPMAPVRLAERRALPAEQHRLGAAGELVQIIPGLAGIERPG